MPKYINLERARFEAERYFQSMDEIKEDLDTLFCMLQTEDVTPVRHGRWDDSGRYRFPGGSIAVRCSECGCSLTASEYKLNKWNYCPVCGAKMDGE